MATETPRCVSCDVDFPHKQQVCAALQSGASVRRDSRRLKASDLIGLYTIRHRVAVESGADESAIADLEWFLSNLKSAQGANVRAWFIHPTSGPKLVVLEDDDRGLPLGCFEGSQPHHNETER